MKRVKIFLASVFLSLIAFCNLGNAQSVMMGEVTPGSYKPLKSDSLGQLTAGDYFAAVGFGDNGTNLRRVAGLGHNPQIDTGTVPEDIWEGGGVYPWLTVATNLEIVSTSANDTAAGTGARTVSVSCLDANYAELTAQVVTLNGLTAVPIPVACFRVNSAIVLSAGTGKVNAGVLNIRDSGGGTVRSILPVGYGITRQSIYTVPAGYTLQIVSMYIAALKGTATASVDVATYFQTNTGVFRLPITISTGLQGVYRHDSLPGIVVTEKTDFALRATSVSLNTTEVTGAWLGVLRKNTIP